MVRRRHTDWLLFFPDQQITSGKLMCECHFSSFLQLSSDLSPHFSLVIWVFWGLVSFGCWSVFWCWSVWCWSVFGAWRCLASKNVPLVKLVSVSFGCGKGGGKRGGGGKGEGYHRARRQKMFRWSVWCWSVFFGAWRCLASKNVSLVKLVSVTCLVRIAAPSKHQQIRCLF